MKIRLDSRKSVYENIAAYFEEAKKWRRKAEGARRAIKETEHKEIFFSRKAKVEKQSKKWFHEYHWSQTRNGFLVVAGKNAKQNDQLVAKHLKEGDLFFHADIVGASATILKTEGKKPTHADLEQAAQIAACYSRAWKQGYPVVDVYAAKPEQVSKHSQGEFVGKGAFLIRGERQWFKNTELKLCLKHEKNSVAVIPFVHASQLENVVLIQSGDTPKEHAAKQLAKRFGVREEELLSVLPGDITFA